MRENNVPVSVILPVYNGARHLRESIESILNQSFSSFEFIIIDDGSQDESLRVIKKYASADSRIRLVSRENRGLVRTLNEGLSMSRGQYIARMDADDVSFPDRLKLQVNYLDKNPDVVLLGVSVIKSLRFRVKFEDLTGKSISTWGLMFRNNIGHPGVMIRARTLSANNLSYREDYKHAEDFKLWTDLVRYGYADVLPRNLLFYRTHPDSVSSIHRKEQALIDRKIVMENLCEKLEINMQDHFFLDVRSWINQMTNAIFYSDRFNRLPLQDQLAIYVNYQEYCAGFGASTFIHLIKTAGLGKFLTSGARAPISLYRMASRQFRKDWKRLEL